MNKLHKENCYFFKERKREYYKHETCEETIIEDSHMVFDYGVFKDANCTGTMTESIVLR